MCLAGAGSGAPCCPTRGRPLWFRDRSAARSRNRRQTAKEFLRVLRSAKYGLYGAVLAGLVGGSALWHHVDKSVTLVRRRPPQLDPHHGRERVRTSCEQAGYSTGPHDLLAPAASARRPRRQHRRAQARPAAAPDRRRRRAATSGRRRRPSRPRWTNSASAPRTSPRCRGRSGCRSARPRSPSVPRSSSRSTTTAPPSTSRRPTRRSASCIAQLDIELAADRPGLAADERPAASTTCASSCTASSTPRPTRCARSSTRPCTRPTRRCPPAR